MLECGGAVGRLVHLEVRIGQDDEGEGPELGLLGRLGDGAEVLDGRWVMAEVVVSAPEEMKHRALQVGPDVELGEFIQVRDGPFMITEDVAHVPGIEEAVLEPFAVRKFLAQGDQFGERLLVLLLPAKLEVRDGELVAGLLAPGVFRIVREEPAVLGRGGIVDSYLEEPVGELELEVGLRLLFLVLGRCTPRERKKQYGEHEGWASARPPQRRTRPGRSIRVFVLPRQR